MEGIKKKKKKRVNLLNSSGTRGHHWDNIGIRNRRSPANSGDLNGKGDF